MNNELFNEELMRLVRKMLDNILYGSDPIVEINFCVNCIETLVGKEFTPEETTKWFDALKDIVIKAISNNY